MQVCLLLPPISMYLLPMPLMKLKLEIRYCKYVVWYDIYWYIRKTFNHADKTIRKYLQVIMILPTSENTAKGLFKVVNFKQKTTRIM